jgi:hypothetical protein
MKEAQTKSLNCCQNKYDKDTRNITDRYCVHNSSPRDLKFSQLNPVHTLTQCLFKISFKVIITVMSTCHESSLFYKFTKESS